MFCKNNTEKIGKEYPTPPLPPPPEMKILMDGLRVRDYQVSLASKLEFLMEDLGTSDLNLPRSPPSLKMGTSHGELYDFGSGLTKNTPTPKNETSHGGLRDFGSEFTRNAPFSCRTRGLWF